MFWSVLLRWSNLLSISHTFDLVATKKEKKKKTLQLCHNLFQIIHSPNITSLQLTPSTPTPTNPFDLHRDLSFSDSTTFLLCLTPSCPHFLCKPARIPRSIIREFQGQFLTYALNSNSLVFLFFRYTPWLTTAQLKSNFTCLPHSWTLEAEYGFRKTFKLADLL